MIKKSYTTNCVLSNATVITQMCDYAKKIGYDKFRRQVKLKDLKDLFNYYNWSDDDSEGLRLKDDYAVSFYESKYKSKPCVYVDHSRIEYIFC